MEKHISGIGVPGVHIRQVLGPLTRYRDQIRTPSSRQKDTPTPARPTVDQQPPNRLHVASLLPIRPPLKTIASRSLVINKYGTMHTDAIITKNKKTALKFIKSVKSSIAIHNSSTQFADGGEFGFGGEVGISTNSLPPRGPVGLNQLVSYKYEVMSTGQIRK